MPGVLFHHETPTKDWFYDLMRPWIHYIPVSTHLDDLRSKYEWAEDHPSDARRISEEASKLAEYILSEEYMKKVYDDLFVNYLGKVVDAYQPEGKSWDDILAQYKKQGVKVYEISECLTQTCRTEWKEGTFIDFY